MILTKFVSPSHQSKVKISEVESLTYKLIGSSPYFKLQASSQIHRTTESQNTVYSPDNSICMDNFILSLGPKDYF